MAILTLLLILIDPEKVSCFGGSFGRFITKYFFGYEMMIISSFKNLLPIEQGTYISASNTVHSCWF